MASLTTAATSSSRGPLSRLLSFAARLLPSMLPQTIGTARAGSHSSCAADSLLLAPRCLVESGTGYEAGNVCCGSPSAEEPITMATFPSPSTIFGTCAWVRDQGVGTDARHARMLTNSATRLLRSDAADKLCRQE